MDAQGQAREGVMGGIRRANHRKSWLGLLLVAAMLLPTVPAWAEDRVALVIGNAAYEHTARLANPGNDARAMTDLLQRLGFEIHGGLDLDKRGMETLLREFGRQAESADVAMVFYAGHAVQVDGENYLLPTDARLANERDLKWDAVPLNYVMEETARVRRLRMVLLDACRDNPLANQMARSMGGRSAAVGRGLAVIETPSGGADTLVVYATEAGRIAADGDGRNSPFTEALLDHLDTPGVEVRLLMGRVRDAVREKTGGRQTPWVNNSLGGSEYYLVSAPQTASLPAPDTMPPRPGSASLEVAFWDSIKDSRIRAHFDEYLKQFPHGTFAGLARLKIRELTTERVQPPTSPSTSPPAAAPRPLTLPPLLIQAALKGAGFNPGGLDGVPGPRTRAAISAFQRSLGDTATGTLTTRQSLALLTQASEKGDAISQNTLGTLYAAGTGVQASGVEAVKWLTAAATQGYVHAQFNLGRLLAQGMPGVAKDTVSARRYLEAAKKAGHPQAAAALARL